MVRVCLCTVSNKGLINNYTSVAVSSVMYLAGHNRIDCREWRIYDNHPISKARNDAVQEFLQDKNNTHLGFIDDDVVPPINLVSRMLSHNKLVVSGWYLLRGNNKPSVFRKLKHGWESLTVGELQKYTIRGNILEEVDGTGMGCCLIDRKALEVVESPYFWESDVGEDLNFCNKLKQYGIQVYVDPSLRCHHFHWILL